MPRPPLTGLYVILDPAACATRSLLDVLQQAVDGGARLFQYRNKTASMREAYREALSLRRAAQDAEALFLVNDRCDVALAVDADGVHLGQRDLPISLARSILGSGKVIGLSTHTEAQVRAANETSADYLAFGPIFAPTSKPDHEPLVGLAGLKRIRPLTALPIFAIGGITLTCVPELIEAGADGVAVISAIMRADDVTATVRAFVRQWQARRPLVH
jgi:thiamine-phosphate pyrophosphorylase